MNRAVVLEYANSLSDEELSKMTMKLSERMCGDLPDVLEVLEGIKPIDTILNSARSGTEFYDMCDQITELFQNVARKRGLVKTDA